MVPGFLRRRIQECDLLNRICNKLQEAQDFLHIFFIDDLQYIVYFDMEATLFLRFVVLLVCNNYSSGCNHSYWHWHTVVHLKTVSNSHREERGGRDTRLHDLRALRIAYFRVLLLPLWWSCHQHNIFLFYFFQNLV